CLRRRERMNQRSYAKPLSNSSGNTKFSLLVFVLVMLLVLMVFPAAVPARAAQTSGGASKVLVDAGDQATINELKNSGSTLLVDYGTFGLWSVSSIQRSVLIGRSSVEAGADFDTIGLRGGATIDTGASAANVPADLRETRSSGQQFWMLQ